MKVHAADNVYKSCTNEEYEQDHLKNKRMAESVVFNSAERTFCFTFNDKTQETIQIDNFEEFSGIPDKDLNKARLGFVGTALVLEDYDLHILIEGLIRDNQK